MKKYSLYSSVLLLAFAGLMNGCTPDKMDNGTASGPAPQASFTLTPVAGSANRFVAQAGTTDVLAVKWDKGDGGGAILGKTLDTLFFPDAGTYNVALTAVGKGGLTSTATKTLTVATSDPVAGNLVSGGKMDAGDDTKWTRFTISNPAITWTLANGKMTAAGGSGGHSAIYQTIQVVANKDYRFSMLVSGSGATDVWFEVYMSFTPPVPGSDYTSGGTRIGLNTWAGCGNSSFNGNISTIGCSGSLVGKNGVIRFTQSGTLYLVIKTGGANLGTTGISIDNVELRGI
jgi:PKD repeat protein